MNDSKVVDTETKEKSYAVFFLLLFVMCLSVFLFSATSPFWDAEPERLDHAFSGSELTRLLEPGRLVSNTETGIVNALWRLLVYGSFGLWGVYLSFKMGFKGIINVELKQPKSIMISVLVGMVMGIFFITAHTISVNIRFGALLMFSYSMIPSSIFSSIAEGIGCQILNMVTVVFIMWIFSAVVKTEEGRNKLFWVAAVLCALIFSVRHIDSTQLWYSGSARTIFHMSQRQYMVIIGVYAPLSLVCTYFFKKYGLLSAITIHFVSDIIWRVIWAYIYRAIWPFPNW
jgi:hypothetical protein